MPPRKPLNTSTPKSTERENPAYQSLYSYATSSFTRMIENGTKPGLKIPTYESAAAIHPSHARTRLHRRHLGATGR